MEERKDRYIQFPLCLLQETYSNPNNGLSMIISYGLVYYATKFKYEIREVARQLMYCYYRKQGIIQDRLLERIEEYIQSGQLTIDEDYNGFDGLEFNPENEINELLKFFESDSQFKDDTILRYQIAQSAGFLCINIGSMDGTIKRYKEGLEIKNKFEQVYGPDCMPMIKPTQVFDFRDSGKDLELFRAYIGIKSLIGQKKFVITTRNVILMRMLGCKSNESLQAFISKNKDARDLYDKYNRSEKALRYHFDKLFDKLLASGFLQSKIFERSVSRKIFLSTTLTHDQLAKEIILYSQKGNFKKKEIEAREMIKATLTAM